MIKEYNKIIAEFLYPDWVHPKDMEEPVDKSTTGDSYWVYAQLMGGHYEELNYHKSWTALMPVVRELVKLDFAVQLQSNKPCYIHNFDQGFSYMFEMEFEDVTELYKAVVATIEYINSKQK